MARVAPLLALLGAAGCAGEAPVPERPTWVDDVQPILQGNCFHCHGGGPFPKDWIVDGTGPNRWDFYDLPDVALSGTSDPTWKGAKQSAIVIFAHAAADMPPAPAAKLSPRDLEVLHRWSTATSRGERRPNAPPGAQWLDRGKLLEIADADGDQVFGKLTCGTTDVVVTRTGAYRASGVTCDGMLTDGQVTVPVTLR